MSCKFSPFSLIAFLSKNRGINILIVIVYFSCVVLPHEWFGNQILKLFENFSRQSYQMATLFIALLFITAYLFYLYRLLRNNYTFLAVSSLIILLTLTALSYPLLIIHYIEAIHYLQYAILAFLLFPLFRNYYKLLFWGLVFSFFDEGYQYFYLNPDGTIYFDFNDIILNQLGLVYGLLPIAIKGSVLLVKRKLNSFFPELITIGLIVIVIIVLCFIDLLSIYPDDTIPLNLVRELPDSFWTEIKHLGVVNYHIVLPVEGVAVIAIIYIYFCWVLTGISYSKWRS